MRKQTVTDWLTLVLMGVGFVALIYPMGLWQSGLRHLFPGQSRVVYPGVTVLQLVWQHVRIVGISSGLAICVGVPLGIAVTRRGMEEFLPLAEDLTALGQTFPPVAVLALTAPVLGFELQPTIVALFLYGLLPIVRNTIGGVRSVPAQMLEAARGMGMAPRQVLVRVELPMSMSVVLAGVRISVIINVGTAMIGALVGAGGLGVPVTAGLVQNNPAYLLEGAVPAALLALLADKLFSNLEATLAYRPGE
jgi:osmoprotectant transport system permease protein